MGHFSLHSQLFHIAWHCWVGASFLFGVLRLGFVVLVACSTAWTRSPCPEYDPLLPRVLCWFCTLHFFKLLCVFFLEVLISISIALRSVLSSFLLTVWQRRASSSSSMQLLPLCDPQVRSHLLGFVLLISSYKPITTPFVSCFTKVTLFICHWSHIYCKTNTSFKLYLWPLEDDLPLTLIHYSKTHTYCHSPKDS